MNDRTSTKVLANGAIRYAVYDEAGNFLRYEYMLLADEPTQEGMPLCKKTLLSDATAESLGLDAEAVPDDALNAIPLAKEDKRVNSFFNRCSLIKTIRSDVTSELRFPQVVLTPDKTKYVCYSATKISLYSNTLVLLHEVLVVSNALIAVDNDYIILRDDATSKVFVYRMLDNAFTLVLDQTLSTSAINSQATFSTPHSLHQAYHDEERLCFLLMYGNGYLWTYSYIYNKQNNTITRDPSNIYLGLRDGNIVTCKNGGVVSYNYGTSTTTNSSGVYFVKPDFTRVTLYNGAGGSAVNHSHMVYSTLDGFFLFRCATGELRKYVTTTGEPVLDYTVSISTAGYNPIPLDGNILMVNAATQFNTETKIVTSRDGSGDLFTFNPKPTLVSFPNSINLVLLGQGSSNLDAIRPMYCFGLNTFNDLYFDTTGLNFFVNPKTQKQVYFERGL